MATTLGLALTLLSWAWVGGDMIGSAPARPALTTSASTVDWINVTLPAAAFAFTLTSAPLPAAEITPGNVVHVRVLQLSTTAHTFTLSSTTNYQFPTTDATSDLQAYFGSHPPLVDLNVSGSMGLIVYGNFTAPPIGEYEYVCLASGHFGYGMWGVLGSGEPGTGAGSAPYNGPGAPVFVISGTITALVIIALVLGFVVGKRRGSSDEMPPQRFGYPESSLSSSTPAAPPLGEQKR
ncbi:MAG: hypothetical protein L3J99_07075 [Thermoplasmata archaeon]|nr:hypothetical protein [Thermoplasmata archaeon]